MGIDKEGQAVALRAVKSRLSTLPALVPAGPKRAENFYLSQAWRGLMVRLKRLRGNRCQDCDKPGGPGRRILGDHVVERKDGGADLDPANIRLLCLPCHNKKTAAAAAARAQR